LLEPSIEFCHGGIGLFPEQLAQRFHSGVITAALAAPRMWSWRNRAGRAAPLEQLLDKRAAHTEQGRQALLEAKSFLIGTEDFLTPIEGIGFHASHSKT
jgi:hypothetical protein